MIRSRSLWSRPLNFLTAAFVLSSINCATIGFAQTQPVPPAPRMESMEDLSSHLTAEQKQHFYDGMKAFNAQHYADAFAIYKGLLSQLPNDALLSKLASESALNTGDTGFALSALKPL